MFIYNKYMYQLPVWATLLLIISGCNVASDIENIGKRPDFSKQSEVITDIHQLPNTRSFTTAKENQSLWPVGTRSFFKDQRAHRLGDVLTVLVDIQQEQGQLESTSERDRKSDTNVAISNLLGVKDPAIIGGPPLLKTGSNPKFEGHGKVDRKETITFRVAVMVQKILPNGNMAIEGKQEIRLNYEVREIYVSGVVRPEDISPQNTIKWDQIAEARISYGGRGQISQFQQPPYGQQFMDVIMPF